MNRQAELFLFGIGGYAAPTDGRQPPYMLSQIERACNELQSSHGADDTDLNKSPTRLITDETGSFYSVRSFYVGDVDTESRSTHIVALIEKIIDRHEVDTDNAKQEFNLTKREVDVLKSICNGLTNKEISEQLFISEHTVKDHIKNIMKKMNVKSRTEILACL